MDPKYKLPEGFSAPTTASREVDQAAWQEQNRSWWQNNPMRYDWDEKIASAEFSRGFFEEIDRRHFLDASCYCPPSQRPFDELIPFDQLPKWDVLEIGIGNGSHAQLIAPHCRSYTGIDLTDYAVRSTRSRFDLFNLPGKIIRMDAERMEFGDESFDFIWTWGVIHHSSNTEQILREMKRVLRPGGRAVTMVYHRSFLYYYVFNAFFRGILRGDLRKVGSLHKIAQLNTDGALARIYSRQEWRTLVENYFVVDKLRIKGQKSELFPLPRGRLKKSLMDLTPNVLCRGVLSGLGQGSFLVTSMRKP